MHSRTRGEEDDRCTRENDRPRAKRADGGRSLSSDGRGVTEVLGYALLLGIVVIGATVVWVFGVDAVDRDQQEIEVAQAEHALSQLDSQASRVALGEDPVHRVDLGLRGNSGSLETDPDGGWISVEYTNATAGQSEQVVNTSLGAVVYENGETTVAYQGGGVWRSDGDGSVMISRPEFHYRNGTLSMPVVKTEGEDGVHSEVEVTPNGPATQAYPDESEGWTNKLEDSAVTITVQSDYYEAWGRYFETEADAIVHYDHDDETVSVTFLAYPEEFSPRSGVIATAGPGNLELEGTDARIDSYNSSEGTYEDTQTTDGEVESAGDVIVSGDASIEGDVRSGGLVAIPNNNGWIEGDVSYTDDVENEDRIGGTTERIDGVVPVPPIDGYVTQTVQEVRADNDNDEANFIQDDRLQSGGTLEEGEYYFDRLDLEGRDLTIDTSDGNVTIAVRDWIKVDDRGSISVEGDGDVEIYVEGEDEVTVNVAGEGEEDVNLFVDRRSSVTVPQERSNQLTLYAQQDFYGTIAGSQQNNRAVFQGVIYAPAGHDGPGEVYLKHADLYGAVVTGDLTLGNRGAVHFDHALRDEYLPISPTVSRLEYLYVTIHEIVVSSA